MTRYLPLGAVNLTPPYLFSFSAFLRDNGTCRVTRNAISPFYGISSNAGVISPTSRTYCDVIVPGLFRYSLTQTTVSWPLLDATTHVTLTTTQLSGQPNADSTTTNNNNRVVFSALADRAVGVPGVWHCDRQRNIFILFSSLVRQRRSVHLLDHVYR